MADFLINLVEFVFNLEPAKVEETTFSFKNAKYVGYTILNYQNVMFNDFVVAVVLRYFRLNIEKIEVRNASAVDGLSKNDLFCTIVCAEIDIRLRV